MALVASTAAVAPTSLVVPNCPMQRRRSSSSGRHESAGFLLKINLYLISEGALVAFILPPMCNSIQVKEK